MPHTHVSNRVHVIFSTKDRKKLIATDVQPRLWSYLGGIARQVEIKTLAIGGMDDHVHLLIGLPPTIALATAVQKLKANSSKWMNETISKNFAWQEGYAAFSVSISHVPATIAYIQNQPEHHRRRTFDDELRQILAKHGLLVDSAVPDGTGP
jgi:putative transposase